MIRVIVFDFDGVIVDSNALKYDAFFKLFPEAAAREAVKAVMAAIGDKTRFKILEQIFRRLGKPEREIQTLVDSHAARYNEIVQQEILKRGLMPGAAEALKDLSSRYALYINSSTPEFALKQALKNLNLDKFLKGSYGRASSENSKESNLKKIIAEERAGSEAVLMVGDSDIDYEAAENCGVRFIGIANDFNKWQDKPFPLLPNLISIEKLI